MKRESAASHKNNLALIGKSGSGKTFLIKSINALFGVYDYDYTIEAVSAESC